ncbi:MAG TPA: peptidylprolyl isomerase [Pirellulaceae bacterium]|nr:peptidylprolyl isomerase [Pirellulaceae bacterium]
MHRRSRIVVLFLVYAIASSGCASAPPIAPAAPTPPIPTSAVAGATTVVAVAAPAEPCCPPPTLWEFLGVKGLAQGVGGLFSRVRNRLGSRFPGLEAKPALLAITDPANMKADAPPAVKAAAEAKAFEDGAAQKVKALRYLAKLGCTDCFPDIEKAILAALDDCSEIVRYEAVLAVRTLAGGPCSACKANSCCTPAITKRLERLANEMDNKGCYVEPSARVRRGARVALAACGGAVAPSDLPTEGPDAVLPDGAAADASAVTTPANGNQPAVETARLPATTVQPQPTPAKYCPRCRTAHADHEPHRDERVMPVDFQTTVQAAQSEAATIMAEVNGEAIFEREVVASLERRGERDRSLVTLRAELARVIDTRLICQDAQRHGFRIDGEANSVQQVAFAGSPTPAVRPDEAELLASRWLAKHLRVSSDINRQEVFNHYRARLDHYQPPAEVRWERMAAPVTRFGSREQAEAAIIYLRERAQGIERGLPKGVDLKRVISESHEWTRKDKAETVDLGHWLFVMPVGTISPVLYDEQQIYVVRVIERRQGRAASLEQAAPHIEQEILTQRRAQAEQQYLASLRRDARVWTLFEVASRPDSAPLP